jgi:PAS domain S-box-containing protein
VRVRNLSIRTKITLIALVTSTSVLVLALASFLVWDLVSFREQLSHDLTSQAQLIGSNGTAAVAFEDAAAASDMLMGLQSKPEILNAAMYDIDGTVFASFVGRAGLPSALPKHPGLPGTHWGSDTLEVFEPLYLNEQRIGTVFVRSDLSLYHQRLRRFIISSSLLLVVAAAFALLLSARLQVLISRPIIRLKASMQEVSTRRDYTVRVEQDSTDEIGEMIGGFNAMLAEIERGDAALQEAHDELQLRTLHLEQEVGDRVRAERELKALAGTLEQRVAERSAAAEERARELARSEEELRHQTGTLQSILHSMGDGVLVTDENGRITLYNDAAEQTLHTMLHQASMLRDVHALGFVMPDMVTPYPDDQMPMSRALRGEAVDAAELFHPQAGDGGTWLSVNARPLRDDDGVPRSAVAVLRDVSEQKRVEVALVRARDAAEAASRAKSAFLANMSHELRTPLNAIIGYSEMMQEDAEDRGQVEYLGDLRKVHEAGKHLLALINDVLDLSKIEAGRTELHIEPFDVSALIQDLLTTVRPLVAKNRNVLDTDLGPALGSMRSDITKVRQVLLNLLSNASKFTSEGRVVLGVSRSSVDGREWVQFRVTDSGIGITREQRERLFQEFAQADASTARKFGGTGLGLAISKRLCDLMGGTISVDSEHGLGSTFAVSLPADLQPGIRPAEADTTASEVDRDAALPPDYVLVIDDDAAARELIARHLRKEGLTAVLAASGAEGLALARRARPLAISLDVLMPQMDGWTVLAALKADPSLADVPVVMLTIVGEHSRGYALGAADYLQKPIDGAALAAVLRRRIPTIARADVLVVDDDESARKVLARHLHALGCESRMAEDGAIALERCAERRPDLVLLDLVMPTMDGFEFLEQLRRQPSGNDVRVVVISGKDVNPAERARLNGQVIQIVQKHGSECDTLLPEVTRLLKTHARRDAAA